MQNFSTIFRNFKKKYTIFNGPIGAVARFFSLKSQLLLVIEIMFRDEQIIFYVLRSDAKKNNTKNNSPKYISFLELPQKSIRSTFRYFVDFCIF